MPSSNIHRALAPTHPLDILNLRSVVGRVCIGPMSSSDVERLWETYSVDLRAQSGWVPVTDETLAGFDNWLKI